MTLSVCAQLKVSTPCVVNLKLEIVKLVKKK